MVVERSVGGRRCPGPLDRDERGIPLLRNPTTAAQVWVDLNNRAARVRSGLGSLASASPDQRAGAAAARVSQAVESLLSTIDTDRGLRAGATVAD